MVLLLRYKLRGLLRSFADLYSTFLLGYTNIFGGVTEQITRLMLTHEFGMSANNMTFFHERNIERGYINVLFSYVIVMRYNTSRKIK